MGFLKDYKEYKRRKQFEDNLAHFGISLEMLTNATKLITALENKVGALTNEVNDLKSKLEEAQSSPKKPEKVKTEEQKQADALLKGKITPEEFVKSFAVDMEELKSNA